MTRFLIAIGPLLPINKELQLGIPGASGIKAPAASASVLTPET